MARETARTPITRTPFQNRICPPKASTLACMWDIPQCMRVYATLMRWRFPISALTQLACTWMLQPDGTCAQQVEAERWWHHCMAAGAMLAAYRHDVRQQPHHCSSKGQALQGEHRLIFTCSLVVVSEGECYVASAQDCS